MLIRGRVVNVALSGRSGILRPFSSFVESVRRAESLKRDDVKCREAQRDGSFILINSRGDPCVDFSSKLLQPGAMKSISVRDRGECSLKYFPYQAVEKFLDPSAIESSILLKLDPVDHRVIFGARFPTTENQRKATSNEAAPKSFLNWRMSFFLLNLPEIELMCKASSMLLWHENHQFCSNCGSKNVSDAAGSHRDCPSCKARHFPETSPAGIVLVRNASDTSALLVCHNPRMRPVKRKYYTCVSGFCDMGESIEGLVRREVAEEVGLDVRDVKYLHSQHWPSPASSLMIGCVATADDDVVPSVDTEELEDARWYTREEIGECLRIADENPLIEDLDARVSIPPKGTAAYALIRAWHDRSFD